jgi:hypothetical protein
VGMGAGPGRVPSVGPVGDRCARHALGPVFALPLRSKPAMSLTVQIGQVIVVHLPLEAGVAGPTLHFCSVSNSAKVGGEGRP